MASIWLAAAPAGAGRTRPGVDPRAADVSVEASPRWRRCPSRRRPTTTPSVPDFGPRRRLRPAHRPADQRHRRALQAGRRHGQRARVPNAASPSCPALRHSASPRSPQPDATHVPQPRRGGDRLPASAAQPAEAAARRARPGPSPRRPSCAARRSCWRACSRDFGVRGEVKNVHPGPVVTLFEFEPARGVKSARVIGLADDIARSLGAASVRAAVVPGPQRHRHRAAERAAREGQSAPAARVGGSSAASDATLPLVLGRDIAGAPVLADLARMPHLLVAGTTGAGKSVGVNAMILSLLYKLSPDQCRFLMIDPEDAGAVGLQRHPAPAVPGGDGAGQGGGGAQLGGRRDGAALPAHVLAGGAQHRRLQQPRAPGAEARRTVPARHRRPTSRRWPTSSSSSTSSPT